MIHLVVCAVISLHSVPHQPQARSLTVDLSRCDQGQQNFNFGCGTTVTYGKHGETFTLYGWNYIPDRKQSWLLTLPKTSKFVPIKVDNQVCESQWTIE